MPPPGRPESIERLAEPTEGGELRFAVARQLCRVAMSATASNRESVLAFSHHKAGSTMLFGILKALAESVGMSFVSVPGELFRRGVDLRSVEIKTDWRPKGFCFGGFRFYPESPLPLIDTARTVLLVRDPRDAVVSLYFSARDSHALPKPDGTLRQRMVAKREKAKVTSIDDWVIENHGEVVEALTGYFAQGFLSRPNVVIYRYEDVVYRKRAWIDDMLAWYGWRASEEVVEEVARKFDVFPETADAARHIRQVRPGNHRTMLKATTCDKLDVCFAHLLTAFGYINGDGGDG